jgi:hypothetical protein
MVGSTEDQNRSLCFISALRRLTRQGSSRGFPELRTNPHNSCSRGPRRNQLPTICSVNLNAEDTQLVPIRRPIADAQKTAPKNPANGIVQPHFSRLFAAEMRPNDANLTQI